MLNELIWVHRNTVTLWFWLKEILAFVTRLWVTKTVKVGKHWYRLSSSHLAFCFSALTRISTHEGEQTRKEDIFSVQTGPWSFSSSLSLLTSVSRVCLCLPVLRTFRSRSLFPFILTVSPYDCSALASSPFLNVCAFYLSPSHLCRVLCRAFNNFPSQSSHRFTSLSRVCSESPTHQNVNSAEAFSLPHWVFLGASYEQTQEEAHNSPATRKIVDKPKQ